MTPFRSEVCNGSSGSENSISLKHLSMQQFDEYLSVKFQLHSPQQKALSSAKPPFKVFSPTKQPLLSAPQS